MSRDALVTLAALDVRRSPSHQAELGSQLLCGESVRILARTRDLQWARVENRSDGYRGWVRVWGLRECSPAEIRAWARTARWRLAVHQAVVRRGAGKGARVAPLFWNSRVVRLGGARGHARVALADGRQGWIESAALRPASRPAGPLIRLAEGFRGAPYLWGGRTPSGLDCSGFVQQVLGARGVCLPRDAHLQFEACRRIGARQARRPGDLVFFGRPRNRISHVGLLVQKDLYYHSRGSVDVSSLDPSNRLYDSALASMVRGFGRPRRRAGGGAHSC